MTHVAICVCTCARPQLLKRLLHSLAALETKPAWRVEVRVVDNDPGLAGEPVVRHLQEGYPFRLRYTIEPVRNIACARNRGLMLGRADLVAFVDDDEQVEPAWLRALISALEQRSADAVFGPVHKRLPSTAPAWITRGGFFSAPSRRGPLTHWREARTGNALVRGRWFFEAGLRFDPAYGRSGGEDAQLFARMLAGGARLWTAPDAHVHEEVTPDRLRFAWLWRRAWRSAGTFDRIAEELRCARPAWWATTLRLGRATAAGLVGVALLLVGRPEGLARAALCLALAGGGCAERLRRRDPLSLPAYGG